MKASFCLLLLVLSLCPVAPRAEVLLSVNNVTEDGKANTELLGWSAPDGSVSGD